MKTIPYLQKGDAVAIISTARKIEKQPVEFAKKLLENWGVNVLLSDNLFAEDNYFAGTDTERIDDLQKAIDNSKVKAIICARGGYGTVRILDDIDWTNFYSNPKWICGFSDVTALHNQMHKMNYPSLHSTMPINFEINSKEAIDSMKKALFGETLIHDFETHPDNKKGVAEGVLVGGNLSIIYSLCGTDIDLDCTDRILFFEDLDEYNYHIDRIFMNFKKGGKLNSLKGIIVGGMTDIKDSSIPFGKSVEQIVLESVNHLNIPICFGFPAGHFSDNRALILGQKIRLTVSDKPCIEFSVN